MTADENIFGHDKVLNAGGMINGYRSVTLGELIENNLRFRQGTFV